MTVAVHGFAEDAGPVARLAARLGVPAGRIELHAFPDGETLPRVEAPAPATVILYRSLHRPNERLLPLLLAADAFRRAGAKRLVLVAPYLCYLRQDAVFHPGEPLSRDVVAGLVRPAFDRLLTVQAHLHRTARLADAFGPASQNLDIAGDLAALAAGGDAPLVVGPDAESAAWARAAAEHIGAESICLSKRRLGDRQVTLTLPPDAAVRSRATLLLDDVCSTGGTLEQAIRLLRAAGAASVDVAVAHALFDADAGCRLSEAGARRIVSSESVPHPTNALPLESILAGALKDELAP